MNKYEILYIIQNEIDDDAKNSIIETYKELVKTLGGSVENVDVWGTRKFAYPINYKTEGYYVLMDFTANSEAPEEINRKMKIDEKIVRAMITRK